MRCCRPSPCSIAPLVVGGGIALANGDIGRLILKALAWGAAVWVLIAIAVVVLLVSFVSPTTAEGR